MTRRKTHVNFSRLTVASFAAVLAACASLPPPVVERNGAEPVPEVRAPETDVIAAQSGTDAPRAQVRYGSGEMIDQQAANSPPTASDEAAGAARFNFEGESVHA